MEAPPTGVHRLLLTPEGEIRAAWRILFWLVVTASATLLGFAALAAAGLGNAMGAGHAVLLVASTVAGWLALRLLDGRAIGALGFHGAAGPALRESGTGTAGGALLLAAAVALMALSGGIRWVADTGTVAEWAATLLTSLAFFAMAAAAEEAIFRGYPFQVLVKAAGVWPALGAGAALFAWGHVANDNASPLGLANILLAGVMLGVAYLRTRSLWFATGVHVGWNWAMSFGLDLPVSGYLFDTPLYDGVASGPAWWTGGTFGPEAGLPVTLAMAGATVWLWRTKRLGPDPRVTALRPLVDEARLPEGWR